MDQSHLYQQIVESIRDDILSGVIKPGASLPPMRKMTAQWNCTTGTIMRAYQELARQGFKKIGTPNNYGPKIFGVSGHVNKPGVFEYPLGVPLKTVLEAAGGVKGQLKGVIVGGLSVPILTAEEAEGLCLDFDSCQKAGTSLGSGGIIVVNDTVSIPELALRTIEFYHHESCGQCVPCRKGSHVIASKLRGLVEGNGGCASVF